MSIFTNRIISNAYMSMYRARTPIMESRSYIYESAIDKNIHRADELADSIAKENFVYNTPVKDANGNIQKYARSGNEMKYNAVYIKHLVGEKIPFSKDTGCRAKFFLGATRIFGDILKSIKNENEINRKCSEFNKILGIIVNDSNHIDEYDNNLNNSTLDELQEKFGQKVKDLSAKEKEEINSKTYIKNGLYTITPCNTWEDIKQFGSPLTTWCVAQKNGRHAYNSYTDSGVCKFYVCTIDGYEEVKQVPGDNTPLDEYGLSMIAVCVNTDGSLKTCTCRWNHMNGGNDHVMDAKQLSELLGVNFFDVFKPRSQEDVFNNLEYDESNPLCSHFKFRYDKDRNYYKFEDNKLKKYKCCYRIHNLACLANTHFVWLDLNARKEIAPPQTIYGRFECFGCEELTSLDGLPEHINGSFDCYNCNKLTSLRGAPSIIEKSFSCSNCNNLTSLEGAPSKVGGTFDCSSCYNLTSLEGSPKKVGGDFNCSYCRNLESLKGLPSEVGGDFRCVACINLTSLKGAPTIVGEDFSCLFCDKLTSLKGAPKKVGRSFECATCRNLNSLVGSPKIINGNFDCDNCTSLVSLRGAPEIIKGHLSFNGCKLKSMRGFPKNVYGRISCVGLNDSLVKVLRKNFPADSYDVFI